MKRKHRIASYLTISALVFFMIMPDFNPKSNVGSLIVQAQNNPNRAFYRSDIGWLKVESRFFVLALSVKGEKEYAPFQYLIISEFDGRLTVEGISTAGESGARRLSSEETDALIARLAVPLEQIRQMQRNKAR